MFVMIRLSHRNSISKCHAQSHGYDDEGIESLPRIDKHLFFIPVIKIHVISNQRTTESKSRHSAEFQFWDLFC